MLVNSAHMMFWLLGSQWSHWMLLVGWYIPSPIILSSWHGGGEEVKEPYVY